MSRQTARVALSRFHNQPVFLAPQYGPDAVAHDLSLLAAADYDKENAAIGRRHVELVSAFGFGDRVPEQRKTFAFAGGTAFIPIHGLLLNRFAYSWGFVTGYDAIRSQMNAALADPDVTNIVFDVNSPGGMAAGCQELADEIAVASQQKPTLAVVDASSFSAAYWLTCGATKAVLTPSGQVGSIGCVVMHASYAGMLEQDGVKITFIYAGQHKVDGNPYEMLSDSVKAEIQGHVDAAYDSFVGGVSTLRGLSDKAVRDTEARVYGAEDALKLGLVDAVQPAREAVIAWTQELAGSDSGAENEIMTTQTEQPTVDAAAVQTAERARISAILGSEEAKGREQQAQHLATATDLSVEAAVAILAASERKAEAPAAGTQFFNAMNNSRSPDIGPGNGTQPSNEGKPANALLASLDAMGFKRENETTH